MKIAYLITAYNNPKHLNRLIQALNNKHVDFYLHIDKKSVSRFELPRLKNIHVIKNNIEVFWGSFTFIDAVLLLLKKAKSVSKYDYYCLISGSDYPIKSNIYILNYFKKNKGKEFINICKMPGNDKTFDRLEYFYFSTYLVKPNIEYLFKIIFNKFIRFFNIKRNYPKSYLNLTLFAGSNWWALSNECIDYIQNYVRKNPDFCKFYYHTYIPEEMFIHTIVGNSHFYKKIKNAFTYNDWNAKNIPLPAEITHKHLSILKARTYSSTYGNGRMDLLFARKFTDKSINMLTEIDKLRKKND